MRKKALRKDFYMEIRKSMGRFLSIFFIVAIGVAFSQESDLRSRICDCQEMHILMRKSYGSANNQYTGTYPG